MCGKRVAVNKGGALRAHKCHRGGEQGGEEGVARRVGLSSVGEQSEGTGRGGSEGGGEEVGAGRDAEGVAGLGGASRGGQRGRGARERLQDCCNTRVERMVLESGMWRLAECQLRPEGRAPMFSVERTRRGIEKVHKVFGLTECEVLVRFNSPRYGMVDMWAPAGTLPRGEGGHFWEEVQTARLRLQAEFRRLDENRVFDPGVGGAPHGGD